MTDGKIKADMAGRRFISSDQSLSGWRPRWQFSGKRNEIKDICAIHRFSWPYSDRREQDDKGKATPSGARKLLIGFGFLAICS